MALGFAEIPFLSLAAVVADQMVKAAQVRLLGKLVAAHVIARPHEDLMALLPK